MTETQLMELNVKQLKDFINLFNISTAAGLVVEKSDLVNLIQSTNLTEQNQVHFRSKIKEFSHKSRSVENLLSDMFSLPSSSRTTSNTSQSNWQPNISNVLPIFFQELFSVPQGTDSNQYPGNTGHPVHPVNSGQPRAQSQNQPQAARSHPYSPPPGASARSSAAKQPSVPENIPTVPQIIKENLDIKTLSSKTLKAILQKYNVNYSGILEKSELEERVAKLIQNMRLEALQANEDLIW